MSATMLPSGPKAPTTDGNGVSVEKQTSVIAMYSCNSRQQAAFVVLQMLQTSTRLHCQNAQKLDAECNQPATVVGRLLTTLVNSGSSLMEAV